MPILNMNYTVSWGWGGNIWEPTDLQVATVSTDAFIKWTDNNLNSIPPTTFAKSELVRKVGSAPTSPSDWTLVVTETVMNTYQDTGYQDSGLTLGVTYYYVVYSYSTDWAISYCDAASVTPSNTWSPWLNTIGYYTMDNDILNHATIGSTFPDWNINTATFSTTRVHWNNTKSLYCSGSTYAYLPASSEFEFWTSDFTVSFWVYSETNSQWNPWIICNYATNSDHNQWWRIVDRMSNANNLSFCWKAGNSYVDNTSGISIYNDWWHNVVLTRSSWNFYLYLDWNTTPKIIDNSHAAYSIWRNANICFWYNLADWYYSKVYLNDVIFEDVAWSAQDVSDYYDLTK